MSGTRAPALVVAVGAGVAIASLPLAAAAGEPYLGLESLNPWLVSYAIGLFVALFATPFVIRRRLGGRLEADARWERALLIWGAIALALIAAGALCGLAGGLGSESLAGSVGLVAIVEGALVVATLTVWLISG